MSKPPAGQHPFLDLVAAALAPWMSTGADHSKDPPPLPPLPGFTPPEVKSLVELFVAADHDLREDRFTAASANLDVAETRLKLAMKQPGGSGPALDAALRDVGLAREAIAKKDTQHAIGAVDDAVRRLLASVKPR